MLIQSSQLLLCTLGNKLQHSTLFWRLYAPEPILQAALSSWLELYAV